MRRLLGMFIRIIWWCVSIAIVVQLRPRRITRLALLGDLVKTRSVLNPTGIHAHFMHRGRILGAQVRTLPTNIALIEFRSCQSPCFWLWVEARRSFGAGRYSAVEKAAVSGAKPMFKLISASCWGLFCPRISKNGDAELSVRAVRHTTILRVPRTCCKYPTVERTSLLPRAIIAVTVVDQEFLCLGKNVAALMDWPL